MTFLTWILAGVLAGLMAGWVVKRGGYGLRWDITLGLVGSIGGSWILRSLGFYPGAGVVATAVVAFIVAAIPLAAQRKFWATERPPEKKDAFWRYGLGASLVALVAWMSLAPVQQPAVGSTLPSRPESRQQWARLRAAQREEARGGRGSATATPSGRAGRLTRQPHPRQRPTNRTTEAKRVNPCESSTGLSSGP